MSQGVESGSKSLLQFDRQNKQAASGINPGFDPSIAPMARESIWR